MTPEDTIQRAVWRYLNVVSACIYVTCAATYRVAVAVAVWVRER